MLVELLGQAKLLNSLFRGNNDLTYHAPRYFVQIVRCSTYLIQSLAHFYRRGPRFYSILVLVLLGIRLVDLLATVGLESWRFMNYLGVSLVSLKFKWFTEVRQVFVRVKPFTGKHVP